MRLLPAVVAIIAAANLAACAAKSRTDEVPKLAFTTERPRLSDDVMSFPGPRTGLRGRNVRVGGISDLILARGEVVLTFDDGPMPGKTPAILKILDDHGVKATFLMVGDMARSYPGLVREVAARGHTIGTHTQSHANLTKLGYDAAVKQIDDGRRSVASALVPSNAKIAPFFRFPYLASTAALRRHLAMQGIIVIDPSVDSKDYYASTPDQVRSRTIAALERKGSGIVLFHDIHSRTARMLSDFLDDLHARGFKVAHLVPKSRDAEALIVAAVGH